MRRELSFQRLFILPAALRVGRIEVERIGVEQNGLVNGTDTPSLGTQVFLAIPAPLYTPPICLRTTGCSEPNRFKS